MGDHLALRPPREEDLTIIEKLTQDPETTGEFAWFGWHDPLRWRRRWAENQLLGDVGGVLMVVRGDRPLGFVNWRRHQAAVAAFYWEIGIAMLPGACGHGDGTQAHRLLARYLFAHSTAHRIEASTETANLAERRALEKAGFTAEGVARAIGWRDGQWRDGVTYSLLRTDPAAHAAPAPDAAS
jgi:RimJ/RimL family protein N-acetyltransferase